VTISIGLLADAPEHADVLAGWFYDEWGHNDPDTSLERTRAGVRRHANRDALPLALVAFEDRTPVGAACLRETDLPSRRDLGPWLGSVYVVPECRGRGIGGALVGRAEAEAWRLGVACLHLFTYDCEGFYAWRGFAVLGRGEHRGRAIVIMEKERPEESEGGPWPALPLERWSDTCATLHLWTQIVGKIRMARAAWTNHSWHVTLYVTARGLTTSPVPYRDRTFEIELDFIRHELRIRDSRGGEGGLPLRPQSVAAFHAALKTELARLGLPVRIGMTPNEVSDPIPFDRDEVHRSYDPEYAQRFWRVLVQADRVFKEFRGRFLGKCSPVHFFWGAPDLAVTRFSGRRAPLHPGGVPNLPDKIVREAYSHEVSSCGFWPGGGPVPYPAFYSYAYAEPAGFAEARVQPDAAFYSTDLREFILPYDAVRNSPSPDETLLAFLQLTYEAAADRGGWDRASLER
jgi:GNAT superfamily N-acetyltransferase